MASAFLTLLDATLSHLAALKERGDRFVEIDVAALERLSRGTPVAKARVAAPTPAPRPALSPAPARPASTASISVSVTPAPAVALAVPVRPADAVPAPGPAPVVTDKASAMDALRQRALVCQRCPPLVASRTQVVFGVGDVNAELMFVGEAPGADEDRLGEPFVGRAGQLLTRIITAMGCTRDTVYIANILKCRPDVPPGSRGNRTPRPDEMDTCKPYLLEQIEIIRPRVIVALGVTAVQGLLDLRTTMGAVRGRWQDFRGTPVMPTFHPSYLLRSEDGPDRGNVEKRKTWEDMLLVLERLERPITERMRGFFLKPPAGT